jgi:hypothetical protein
MFAAGVPDPGRNASSYRVTAGPSKWKPAVSVRWTLHPKSNTRQRKNTRRSGGEIPVHMSQSYSKMFGPRSDVARPGRGVAAGSSGGR